MVFPEGVKGTGKPFSERYRLQRFGRGGFVEIALRTGAPIIPVAVVGSEEIYPKLAESRALARAVGAPFVPITPTFPWLGPLGLVPLPSRWRIEFCEPIDLSAHPGPRPPTTAGSSSTSPSRSARRSRRSSTRTWSSGVRPSSRPGRSAAVGAESMAQLDARPTATVRAAREAQARERRPADAELRAALDALARPRSTPTSGSGR